MTHAYRTEISEIFNQEIEIYVSYVSEVVSVVLMLGKGLNV